MSSLRERLQSFDQEYNDFHRTNDEICITITRNQRQDLSYFQDRLFEEFVEKFYVAYADVENLLMNLESMENNNRSVPIGENSDNILNAIHHLQSSTSGQNKLPTLQPLVFSGKYSDWKGFNDQFYAMIHTNNKVHKVQKFQYLFAAIQGRARNIIKHLLVAETRYESALELLKEEFENKRAIFSNAIIELMSVEKTNSESLETLRNLYTIIHESTQTFKNIEINTVAIDPFIAYLSIEKLPNETRKELEKKVAGRSKDYLSSIKDVIEQIQTSIRTLELIHPSKDTEFDLKPLSKSQKTHKSIKSLHFTKDSNSRPTSRASSINSNHQREIKCALCTGSH